VRDGLAATTAGYCQLAYDGGGYIIKGNVAVVSASIQCCLTGDAAKCGPYGCGDLVMWGQGEATQFGYVVIEGPPPEFTDGTCPRLPGGIQKTMPTPLLTVDNTTQQLLDAAKQAGREAAARGEPVLNIGKRAVFYSGPITVQSRTRVTRWQHGWITYAALGDSDIIDETSLAIFEATNGPLPRVTAQDFNTYLFELYSEAESS
jgi:hypothetical protein